MKIPIESARAVQLRWYLSERYGLKIHKTASKANLLAKLRKFEQQSREIEVPDTIAETREQADAMSPDEPQEGATPATPAANGNGKAAAAPQGIDPEMLVEAMMAQGVPETQARAIAERSVRAESQTRALPQGADPMRHWAVIHIQRMEEAGGSDPVPVIPNGMAQLLERGRDIEVRWPYVEVLQHAEKIVYDEILDPDGIHRHHVPRVVQTYPFQILRGPYERPTDYVPHN